MYTTSLTLLERLRQPEPQDAWKRFVHLYHRLLFHWARKAGLQEQDAADVVQEIFLVLVRKLPEFRYDEHKSFHSWLCTIVRNKLIDRRRREVVRAGQASAAALENLPDSEVAGVFDEAEYRRHVLAQALSLLQGEFQSATWKAFTEHGLNGRAAKEVAQELGLSVGAVYSAKFKIVSRLREEVRDLLA